MVNTKLFVWASRDENSWKFWREEGRIYFSKSEGMQFCVLSFLFSMKIWKNEISGSICFYLIPTALSTLFKKKKIKNSKMTITVRLFSWNHAPLKFLRPGNGASTFSVYPLCGTAAVSNAVCNCNLRKWIPSLISFFVKFCSQI